MEPEYSFWNSLTSGITEFVQMVEDSTVELAQTIDSYVNEWTEPTTESVTPTNASNNNANPKQNLFQKAAENWENQIIEIWKRDAKALPIHIDLPRLVNKITLRSKDGSMAWQGDPEATGAHQICPFLYALQAAFGDTNLPVATIGQQIEVQAEASNALESVLHDSQYDFSKCAPINLLKAMHQQMLFPAYYKIKALLNSSQTNDKPHTWSISIEFNDDDTVTVFHRKQQVIPAWTINGSGDSSPVVTFEWELRVQFTDCSISEIRAVTCGIIRGEMNADALDDERQAFFRSVIPNLVSVTPSIAAPVSNVTPNSSPTIDTMAVEPTPMQPTNETTEEDNSKTAESIDGGATVDEALLLLKEDDRTD